MFLDVLVKHCIVCCVSRDHIVKNENFKTTNNLVSFVNSDFPVNLYLLCLCYCLALHSSFAYLVAAVNKCWWNVWRSFVWEYSPAVQWHTKWNCCLSGFCATFYKTWKKKRRVSGAKQSLPGRLKTLCMCFVWHSALAFIKIIGF